MPFENHARKIAQDHFDSAKLIDAAARSIHVLHTDAYALDSACKFSQFLAQLLPDARPFFLGEIGAEHANVSRNNPSTSVAGLLLQRSSFFFHFCLGCQYPVS